MFRRIALALPLSLLGCLNPADEILRQSSRETGVLFVKIPGHDVAGMEPERTNVDEFVAGTDIYRMHPMNRRGEGLENLTGSLTMGEYPGAALDPEVSPDQTKMVFSLRRGYDSRDIDYDREWHIWEMNLLTLEAAQLTRDGLAHNMDPAYLPDGRIVFTSTRTRIVDEYERRESPLLFIGTSERDERGRFAKVKQISFNQSHDLNPFVHSSGKIYFCRWEHLGSPNRMPLFTIDPDGTNLFVLFGNHSPIGNGQALVHARELRDGRLVSSVMRRGSAFEGGAIALLDISRSDDAVEYVTPGGSPYEGDDESWLFQTPHPVMDGGVERILVSGAPAGGRESGRGGTGEINYGLWMVDKDGGTPELVYDDPDAAELDPIPLEPPESRIVANTLPSSMAAYAQWFDPPDPGGPTGFFFTADVNLRSTTDGQPHGADVAGRVRFVRVLEAVSMDGNSRGGQENSVRGGDIGRTNQEKQRVLGYAPVEEDGSFAIEVPANRSLHVQTLDERGMMLVNQRTWIQVMPGERRLCTGCHDSHDNDKMIFDLERRADGTVWNTAPGIPNLEEYLYRAGFNTAAEVSAHPAARGDTVDFFDRFRPRRQNTIQALFDARCISCHGRSSAPVQGGNLVLENASPTYSPGADDFSTFRKPSDVYRRLWPEGDDSPDGRGYLLRTTGDGPEYRPYVTDQGARQSPLLWILYHRRLDRDPPQDALDRVPSYDHRAVFGITDSLDEFADENRDLLTLIEWVDAGAQYSNTVGY